MSNPLRILPILAILVGLIFGIFILRFLPVFIGVLFPLLIYYIFKHKLLRTPGSSHHSKFFYSSDPAEAPDSAQSSRPTGVPRSSQSPTDDRDYDIVIDSKTQKEYHIPRKKQ